MPSKITLPEYTDESAVGSVRVNTTTLRRLKTMAVKTRSQSYGQLASMLLDWAMDHVELKPVTVYDAVMKEDEEGG